MFNPTLVTQLSVTLKTYEQATSELESNWCTSEDLGSIILERMSRQTEGNRP